MFSLSSVILFNLYDKSRPENQTKWGEINSFRKILKVLIYVFCSKRIDFRAMLRNTLGTPSPGKRVVDESQYITQANLGR